ncbi:MAG: hypothetical protein ACRD2T_09755 [Thermoanaerobaculia bacterium]
MLEALDVREYLIPAEGRKPPQAAARPPAAVLPEGEPRGSAPRARLRERDFIFRYDGRFLGHFRARRPVTPRFAFGQVARELRSRLPDFKPELLTLYLPIKLRVKCFAGAEVAAAGGAFDWFGPPHSE